MALEPLFGLDKDGNPRALHIDLGSGKWSYFNGTLPVHNKRRSVITFQRIDEELPPREYVSAVIMSSPEVVLTFYSKAHAQQLRDMLNELIEDFDRPK